MTEIGNINAFSLYGNIGDTTQNNTNNPWLRIKKEPNKLPVAELITKVLYWKVSESTDFKDSSYVFYSYLQQKEDGKTQSSKVLLNGKMQGFPLMKPNNIDIPSTWILNTIINQSGKLYKSRIIKENGDGDILTGDRYYTFPPPLKELNSNSRDIIVLDFQNIVPVNTISTQNTDIYEKYPLKYLVLRITGWNEESLSKNLLRSKTLSNVGGDIKDNSILYQMYEEYKYTYTCDIINPYDIFIMDPDLPIQQNQGFADMNLNFFQIKNKNNNKYYVPWWIKKYTINRRADDIIPDDFFDGNFDVSITMRPSYNFTNISTMFRGDIILCMRKDLDNNIIDVRGTGTFDGSTGFTYPINGSADWNEVSPINIPESMAYAIDYLTGSMINNAGWKDNIILKNTDVSNNITSSQYTFKNPIWYSLNSPRHVKVNYTGSNISHKWAVNYTHAPAGGYTQENEGNFTMSTGYARNPKTLDMGRKTYMPYFCKTEQNTNTNTTVNGLDINISSNIDQYADGNNEDSKWFTNDGTDNVLDKWLNSVPASIQYKLLVPLKSINSNEPSVEITYLFGEDYNSVTTFYRDSDLSGVYNPLGDTNQSARRKGETITLRWSNNIDYQTIKIFDVASGSKNNEAIFSLTNDPDLLLYFVNVINVETDTFNPDYDLMTNIFQIYLVSNDYQIQDVTNENFKKNECLKKLLILSTSEDQFYTIKTTPENFIPYRYYNGEITNAFFDPNNTLGSYNPFLQDINETIFFNPSKYTTIEGNNGYINGGDTNADIINPSTQNLFTDNGKVLNINGNVNDEYFNIVYSGTIGDQGTNPVILNRYKTAQSSKPDLTIQPYPTRNRITNTNIPYRLDLRPIPSMLDLKKYFLQDYWKWIPSVCRSQKVNNAAGANFKQFSYKNYNVHNQISGFIEPVDVTLNISAILINTRYNENDYIIKPYPCPDNNCSYNKGDPILSVIGGDSVSPNIQQDPFIPFLILDPKPPNPTGVLNTQETPWEGQAIVQTGGGDSYVQIAPYIDSTPYRWTTNSTDEGWNSGSFIELFKAKEEYPTLTTRQERSRWNQLYTLTMRGVDKAYFEGGPPWYNNPNYLDIPVAPVDGIKVNCVELWPAVLKNEKEVVNDSSNLVSLIWDSYFFDPTTQGDICWTVTRENVATGEKIILLDDEPLSPEGSEYIFRDRDVKVYDKLFYSVSGQFKWKAHESSDYLILPIQGFSTNTVFVCKNNKFQYGRYNTTSTNLKLYRPLLIRQNEGQCDDNNNCVGGACRGLVNGKMETLYVPNSKIQTNNNIYANTSNQLTQKQIYVLLAKANFRPFR